MSLHKLGVGSSFKLLYSILIIRIFHKFLKINIKFKQKLFDTTGPVADTLAPQ